MAVTRLESFSDVGSLDLSWWPDLWWPGPINFRKVAEQLSEHLCKKLQGVFNPLPQLGAAWPPVRNFDCGGRQFPREGWLTVTTQMRWIFRLSRKICRYIYFAILSLILLIHKKLMVYSSCSSLFIRQREKDRYQQMREHCLAPAVPKFWLHCGGWRFHCGGCSPRS